jgi:enhancer of mRNA-decapping protein 3
LRNVITFTNTLTFFKGKITKAEQETISITNVFHNGVKMIDSFAEVRIGKTEIDEIKFLKMADPADVAARLTPQQVVKPQPTQETPKSFAKSPANFSNNKPFKPVHAPNFNDGKQNHSVKATKPIAILRKPSPATNSTKEKDYMSTFVPQPFKPDNLQNGNGNGKKKKQQRNLRNYDLMQNEDFSEEGDFDFEFSNSLFDKKEIFKEIDNENIFGTKNPTQKPDLVRQLHKPEEKYRHDENVLDAMLMQFRNVQLEFKPKQEYTTEEPMIIIPSIPQSLRNRIQNLACDHGHSMERQNDFLARGASELALNLLGGSRRLSPKNQHQWPRVTIICDEPYNFRQSEIGLSTARQLASHGLKVMVYVKTSSHSDKSSKELELFTATGNDFTGNVKDLFMSDLVIMSVSSMNQNSAVIRYIQENRAPVMAIDPPATGISEITIRNAVLPILPLDDIHNTCGKLHLVNICISEKFFKDAGIKPSPIFGSKFMIPLHLKN